MCHSILQLVCCYAKIQKHKIEKKIFFTPEDPCLREILQRVAARNCTIMWPHLKVTVQFETEGSGQIEIVSNMDRSEVKL